MSRFGKATFLNPDPIPISPRCRASEGHFPVRPHFSSVSPLGGSVFALLDDVAQRLRVALDHVAVGAAAFAHQGHGPVGLLVVRCVHHHHRLAAPHRLGIGLRMTGRMVQPEQAGEEMPVRREHARVECNLAFGAVHGALAQLGVLRVVDSLGRRFLQVHVVAREARDHQARDRPLRRLAVIEGTDYRMHVITPVGKVFYC